MTTTDVAELLRSMPDLEPPADAWRDIVARQTRRARLRRMRWSGGLVAAVSVVFAIVGGALYLRRAGDGGSPGMAPPVKPIMVSAPAMRPDVRVADARVRALQQRSHFMERVLSEMPRRSRVARADTAGVIAELEDRIAAVDYQLNRAAVNRTGFDRAPAGRPARQAPVVAPRFRMKAADTSDLWRRRVEYMDQLVRARYAEASATGY